MTVQETKQQMIDMIINSFPFKSVHAVEEMVYQYSKNYNRQLYTVSELRALAEKILPRAFDEGKTIIRRPLAATYCGGQLSLFYAPEDRTDDYLDYHKWETSAPIRGNNEGEADDEEGNS